MSVRYNQIGYVCIFKFEITSDFNCAYFFFVHKIKRDFKANKFAETKTTLREKSKTKPFKMCTQNDSNIKKAKQIKNFNKHVVLSATRVWFFYVVPNENEMMRPRRHNRILFCFHVVFLLLFFFKYSKPM